MTKVILGPRQQKKRKKIIECAAEAFMQQGYSGTSMNGLIRLVGGSKATLYAHFSNKDELFDTVIEQLLEDAKPELDIGCRQGMAIESYLRRVSQCYTRKLETEQIGQLIRLLIEAARVKPELGALAEQVMIFHFARQLEAELAEAQEPPDEGWEQFSISLIKTLFSVVVMQALLVSGNASNGVSLCPTQFALTQHLNTVS